MDELKTITSQGNKTSTGTVFLDELLDGGYENDVVTTIYGPSSAGKTNICLLAAIKVVERGKKVIFIDTEGGIAVERIKQLSKDYEEILNRMIFFNPVTFNEQKETFERIIHVIDENVGMIVIDSIAMLYRLELGKGEEIYDVNSALGKQIGYLVEISRKNKIPVLITNQVYTDFDNRNKVKMVGGDLLKYGSKCLIELQKNDEKRLFLLKKHRYLPDNKGVNFKIIMEGIEKE